MSEWSLPGCRRETTAHLPAGGWAARLELGFEARHGRTALVHRSHRGPLTVQRPFYPGDGVCHLYLLHPPAGVVGGDTLAIDAELAPGTAALITTPGAGKIYRSAGPCAAIGQTIRVAAGASLEWLPQETIVFPGARCEFSTCIHVRGDARIAAWEIHCLGLPVMGQPFDQGRLDYRLSLWRDGEPLLLERLSLPAADRGRASGLRGMPVTATFVIGPAGSEARDLARSLLDPIEPDLCAATLIDRMLLIRYLGNSTAQARRLLGGAWQALRPSVMGRPPCEPRIWAT